jgi:CelD/BcsL family acetyltransferase involved in cellulose biosynthesis
LHSRALGYAMNSDIVRISDLSERDLGAWAELAEKSVEPNPFVEPHFVLPATHAWGGDDVGLLRVTNGATWLAAVPVHNITSWHRVPGRCLAAWRHPYCYLSNPLIADDDLEAVTTLLQRGYRNTGCLVFDWVALDGPFGAALRQQRRRVELQGFERAALYKEYAENGDKPVGARSERTLRRKRKLLEREGGEVRISDRSGDRAAYERFLEIEAAGWRGPSGTGTAMACRPGHAAFFTDMCERFASLGRLRLPVLESDDRIFALKSDLVAGDVLYHFKAAFDEQYARFSPGLQLELASMEAFQSGGWKMFDACTAPDNSSFNKLWPEKRRIVSLAVSGRDRLGTMDYAKWRTVATAGPPIRQQLRQLRERRAGATPDSPTADTETE